jgi:hypothetical protein
MVPSTLIPVSNHRDLVYDPLRRLLDITSGGSVLQWNPGTQALTTLVNVGGTLNGADISPDGSTLYFAQQQTPGTRGLLFALNLNTLQMVPASYSPVSGEGGPWDVAVASNGTALFDGIATATAPVPVRQLTLGSNSVTIRTDDPGSAGGGRVQANTLIHRSADRSLLLFTEPNNPAGPFFTYNATTNTFGPRLNLGIPNPFLSAVNRNGRLMAFDLGNQVMVMDNNFNVRNQLGGLYGGVVFDPNQDVMYAVWPSGDQIVAFDTNTWAVKYQLPIGEPVGPDQAFGNGVIAVSSDSSMLFLSTASGVRVFSLPTSGPAVALSFSGFPQVTTAGTSSTFTVAALDANGHVATGYLGTITFFSSDPRAVLPANYTFTPADAGVHTFSAAFRTAGNQYIAAHDVVTGAIQGGVGGILVNPGPLSQFAVVAPTTPQPAGYPIALAVAAEDASGNIITNYTGRVHFTSSDPAAQLPGDYTFTASDQGVHTFTTTPQTSGNQSFSVRDTANSAINGTATVPIVNSVPGLHFSLVVSPATDVAGSPFTVTVTALDTNNNIGTHYAGTVSFSAAPGSVLPANYTFTAADNGVHTFTNGFTLFTAGNQTINVRDVTFITGGPAGSGTTTVTITPAAVSTFTVSGFPSPVTAGTSGTITVTARDPYGNVVTGYTGTVHLSSSDGQAALPANYTFSATDQGVHSFTATLKTAGSQSLTAADTANGSLTGTESAITVNPGSATTLFIGGFPTSVTANVPVTFTVTAQDAYGNVVTSYNSRVHFSAPDWRTVLPADTALTNGTGTFSITFWTAGTQSFSVWDAATGAPAVQQSGIIVNPGPVAGILANAGTTVTAGTSLVVTITAIDCAGNTAPSYRGTIQFNSSDPQATLPATYTFTAADAGVHTFTVVLRAAGARYVAAWDYSNLPWLGTQANYTVNSAAASQLVLSGYPSPTTAGTANNLTVTARDAYGNTATGYTGTVSFSSSDPQAALPAAYTFTASDAGVHTFSATLKTAGSQSLTVSDAAAGFSAGQTGITVTAAAAFQFLISGPTTAQAGVAFNLTLTVVDAYGNVVTGYTGTVHFSSSDQQAGLPADYTFGSGDAGVHTFSVILQTPGIQTITITDTLNSSLTASTQVSL